MNVTKVPQGRTEIYMHTSDRNVFKRCRRKWFISSPFRLHKRQQSTTSMGGVSAPLWFGSGIHYAMEDYHGHNIWKTPQEAFDKYVSFHNIDERPLDWEELYETGMNMLTYYEMWEHQFASWKTAWLDNKPLVEVNFALILEELTYYIDPNDSSKVWHRAYNNTFQLFNTSLKRTSKWLDANGYIKKEVSYGGTFDRVVEDQYGDWWLLDYKTAKSFDTKKLPLDPQISAYCWAAEQWFGRESKGMVYLQLHKSPPKEPKVTTKGISTDKRQRTNGDLYLKALKKCYPNDDFPQANVDMLVMLNSKEHDNGNDFIRYDFVDRTEEHKRLTYHQFIAEGLEMINPNLSIYSNPTIDCSWDCQFRELCIAYEEGADWKFYLDLLDDREEAIDDEIPQWRQRMNEYLEVNTNA